MKSVDEKDQRIQQLENENRFLQELVKRLEHNVEALTQAVLHASKQRFGASSEKTPPAEVQYSFWEKDTSNPAATTEAPVIHIKEHKRPLRKKGDREKLTANLPREMVECILNPEEALCRVCDSEMKIIGKKKVRSEMEYIPAKLVMKDYVQYIYNGGCTKERHDGKLGYPLCGGLVKAPVRPDASASFKMRYPHE